MWEVGRSIKSNEIPLFARFLISSELVCTGRPQLILQKFDAGHTADPWPAWPARKTPDRWPVTRKTFPALMTSQQYINFPTLQICKLLEMYYYK